ncbi:MAG TPA: PrsW family glutamic-type intramembrane protease [Bacteroidales bacterium]|nr:PrsW family glutamic-type intramembrane protease [Bacteroidales bacterium]HOG56626.1 PrsW family glutamic-type intramembrane protease [Bacteroidales bacterium]HPV16140.1 PrsW family glutamic-type intramembrane protease [Bacteroidales bacterium]HPX43792.1 PrsW family glutamic-type intramembrane protease [Bacteroidales bacterium]HQB86321.1 PrsW family glutamic-type intramembrane protease [Bacteroidales bacterium]
MFNNLLFISLAPIFIIAFYIYSRDIYEKEPISYLLKALSIGAIIVLPVVFIEKQLSVPAEKLEGISNAAWIAFIVAGLTEEGMKYLAFLLFFWKSSNFNERFDGIVYAVYISLGFAGIENILYVFSGGYSVGIVRALTAVPAHALFGVVMGYYFGLAKFYPKFRGVYLILAFFLPFVFHGLYDFLLMANSPFFLSIFIPLFIYFWIIGFRKISIASDASVFRKNNRY